MSAYYSTDGSDWTLLGTETVQMPATVYVGLAVTSHDPSYISTGTFSNVVVSAPTHTNAPPTVAIIAPVAGTILPAATSLAVTAAASDSDGTVNRVDFFANGTPIGTSTAAPFITTWPNVAAGTYSLTAVAIDNGGGAATSPGVLITVATALPASVPTRVVFTPPTDYATNVTSCTVQLRRATDPLSATPIAQRNLGKPTPVNGEVSMDITTLVDPLAPGSYYAVIVATGPGGSTASAPSSNFTK
jgi:chitinase